MNHIGTWIVHCIINAGANMLIFGNQLCDLSATELFDCIEVLVLTERIPAFRIDDSYQQVFKLER